MKRILPYPEPRTTGKQYWRSLEQLQDTPQFRSWLEREFPQGASEFQGGDVSRRHFLQLMGASLGLAGLSFAGCRRPEKHLVPFTRGVEWSIPGKALFFATARPGRTGYAPLVATTFDGRPTKMEGNPLHAVSKGATDTWSQSSVLDLYDPDRSRVFRHKGHVSNAADFEKALDELLKNAGDGSGVAFLLEENNSPTRERLRAEIEQKLTNAHWAIYEPLDTEAPDKAAKTIYGEGVVAAAQLDRADVIMALDADFLSCTEGSTEMIRQFAARRRVGSPEAKMNRLYVVENRYTITGGTADHRLRVPACQIGAFAFELAKAIAAGTSDPTLGGLVREETGRPAVKFKEKWVEASAADLLANKGKSLVLVGTRQPAAVHALVAAINHALGNLGQTIVGRPATGKPGLTIAELGRAITDKKVKTLFVVGGNPVYNAPADLEWAKLQGGIETVVRLGTHEDETSKVATWHAPLAHYLESWGDGRATDGSYVSVQPMILPLFGAWSELDLLAKIAGRPKPAGPELIQETFKEIAKPADFVTGWAKFLHDGFLEKSAPPAQALTFNGTAASGFVTEHGAAPVLDDQAFEVVLVADAKLEDGRYNNNGWLQELPDPISKLTWDNAAWMSPATAKALRLKDGDTIEITLNQTSITIPILISPGHADRSLTIPLGYGRTETGRVGTGAGVNAYPLRTSAAPYFLLGATVRATGGHYPLAITQEHGSLEARGPDLTREGTLSEYKADPDFAKVMGTDAHGPPPGSLYSHPPLEGLHQWGMTIDLNSCIGCSACMLACQAENNVPIVGKRQVIDGREMHWLRMDRYFATMGKDDPEPELVSQPMLCQHCENAPCETVCPVNATVHSDDGLNVMAYNRCVGTRYCANNCPFKVRRFNFFDYNERKLDKLRVWNLVNEKGMEETLKLQKNPNVTVRMRGVMEKCTFCVQRIQEAKIAAKVAARDSANLRIPADAFTVACAQACPTEAITFGDIKNPDSKVAKLKESERGYRLFEFLNLKTRTWYLARIRNPNPEMPDAEKSGKAMKEGSHGHGPHKNHHAPAHPEKGPA
ncbi:MAG: TAT-variant-translocated molybdopterin oxidoreductase [Verrucomicrobiota bacterium]|nr:TAT-variant-translocated molybdopterin oxidoreductase [Verrucomicrobiota bacterium]